MRSYLFLYLTICFLITTSVFAQEEKDKLYTRAGFKTGINYTGVMGDIEADSRIRMHLGAVIEFPVSQKFFIQVEPMYTAQGYRLNTDGEENDIDLNYLALPILAKFYVADGLSLESGLQLATLANASQTDEETSDDFFNMFSNSDYSWSFGVSYMLNSGLFFQARYNLGLTNINDIDSPSLNYNYGVAQFSIGYLFRTENNRRQDPQF